jgi:hypothetical protein
MKQTIIAVFLGLGFISILFAGQWRTNKDYQSYKQMKATAVDAESIGDTMAAVSNYLSCAKLATQNEAKEIAAWQYNSASFCLIKKFKEVKNYQLLKEAEGYLVSAQALSPTAADEKINSNIDFINFYLKGDAK